MATKKDTPFKPQTNPWFRMYAEFINDPKVQMLSELLQRRYIMLMCLKCNNTLHTLDDTELAFSLRITEDELQVTKAAFLKRGFVDSSWNLLNWDKRQFISDSSKDRVAKYREKRRAAGLSSNGYIKHTEFVFARDGNSCVYCGQKDKLCLDHAYPIALGGYDDVENLVCACKACNSGKAGRTPYQAGYEFLNKNTEQIWLDWASEKGVTVTVTS